MPDTDIPANQTEFRYFIIIDCWNPCGFDTEFSEDALQEILVVHLANIITRCTGFSPFEDEVDLNELQSAQILKIEPETIESFGEELKQIMRDVAHLF